MKKYIYTLFLLLPVSFSNAQYVLQEPSVIPITKINCVREIPTIPPSRCEFDLVVEFSQYLCMTNITSCRSNATVFIDGVEMKTFNCFELKETINNNPDNSNPDQPTAGLEGHNFIEEPAIIYPNPVKDIMNVKSTDPITVIEILNIHGEVEQIMDPKEEQLDVSHLPAGIYYVRIYFESRKTIQVEKIEVVK